MEKIFHANGKQKKAGVAIRQIDLKIKKITRDKEGHYIMIKGRQWSSNPRRLEWSIQEEDTTIVNIYATNTGAPQYVRQTVTDIKGEIDSNTIIVGGFNTSPTPMDKSLKQKMNKETQVLNYTLGEMDLIDIVRTCDPNAEEYTFLPSAQETFARIDHILGHKWNLSKFKKTEIISNIFSSHNAMRLDIKYKKKNCKKHKHMKIKQHVSKQPTGYWRNQKWSQKNF